MGCPNSIEFKRLSLAVCHSFESTLGNRDSMLVIVETGEDSHATGNIEARCRQMCVYNPDEDLSTVRLREYGSMNNEGQVALSPYWVMNCSGADSDSS